MSSFAITCRRADAYLFGVNGSGNIALVTAGSLGDSLHEGPIEFRDVLAVVPFMYTLATVSVPGWILVDALRHGVSQSGSESGAFLQVSGLEYDIVLVGDEARLADVTVKGAAVDPNGTYVVVLNRWIADGNDGYDMFGEYNPRDTGRSVAESLAAFLTARPEHYETNLTARISVRQAHRLALGALCDEPSMCSAIELAVEAVNTKDDGIFDGILRIARIETFAEPTLECDAVDAIAARVLNHSNASLVSFVGPQCSSSDYSGVYPFVSPTPSCHRGGLQVAPSIFDIVQALVNLFDLYNWSQCAVLAGISSRWSEALADEFAAAFDSQHGTKLLYKGTFEAQTAEARLRAIDSAGATIILLSATADEARTLWDTATDLGLLVGSGVAWVLPNATIGLGSPRYSASFIDVAGAIALSYDPAPTSVEAAMLDKWQANQNSTTSRGQSIDEKLASDAVFAVAFGLNAVLDDDGFINYDALVDAIKSTSFEGATGVVAFDQSTGGRTGLTFAVENCRTNNGTAFWVRAGTASGEAFGAVSIEPDGVVWPGGSLIPPSDDRPPVTVLIGALCASIDDVACVHIQLAVDIINNHNDGFLDGTLEFAQLEVYFNETGCNVSNTSLAFGAATSMKAAGAIAIVGLPCANEAIAVSALGDIPVLSYALSLPETLTTEHALFVKTAPPELHVVYAIIDLAHYYGWDRIAVLSGDSDDSKRLADVFVQEFEQRSPRHTVPCRCEFAEHNATDFEPYLHELHNASARIVLLVTDVFFAARVFKTVARTGLIYGLGHAWLGLDAWTTEALYNDDPDVWAGATGAMGIRKRLDIDQQYKQLWMDATGPTYAGFNRSTVDVSGSFAADSVFAIANALDAIYATDVDAATLVARILDETFRGASGLVSFTEYGDREGEFDVVNLNATAGRWVSVATGIGSDLSITGTPIWPGNTTVPPTDEVPIQDDDHSDDVPRDTTTKKSRNSENTGLVIRACLFALAIVIIAWAVLSWRACFGRAKNFSKASITNVFFSSKAQSQQPPQPTSERDDEHKEAVRAILDRKRRCQSASTRVWRSTSGSSSSSTRSDVELTGEVISAALHTTAAIHGLPFQQRSASLPRTLDIFRLRHSRRFRGFLGFMVIVQCGLCFFEGACTAQSAPHWKLALAVEWACIASYFYDVALAISLNHVQYAATPYLVVHYATLVTIVVDAMHAFVHAMAGHKHRPVRFSRGLRPFLLLAYDFNFSNLSRQVIRSLTDSLDMLFVGLCFLVVGAYTFTTMFEDNAFADDDFRVSDARTNSRSFFTLARLVTTANVANLVNNLHIYHRTVLLVFIVAFSLAVYFYLSLFLGELTLLHAKHRELQVLFVLQQQALNLSAAFSLIEVDGLVTIEAWRTLMAAVDPRLPDYVVDLFFHVVDVDRSGAVSRAEFVDLGDVITSHITETHTKGSTHEHHPTVWAHAAAAASFWVKQPAVNWGLLCVALANFALQWAWPDYVFVDRLFAVIASFEAFCHLGGKALLGNQDPGEHAIDVADVALTLTCTFGSVALLAVDLTMSHVLRHVRLWRVLFVLERCRFKVNDNLLRPFVILRIIGSLVPLFVWLLTGLAVLLYFFAITGTEAFCSRVADCRHNRCEPRAPQNGEPNYNFAKPEFALFTTLFSFLAGGAADATDATFWHLNGTTHVFAVRLYWCAFIFLLDLVYANIAASIIIDAYELEAGRLKLREGTYEDFTTVDAGYGVTIKLSCDTHSPVRRAISQEILRYHIALNTDAVLDLQGLRQRALQSLDLIHGDSTTTSLAAELRSPRALRTPRTPCPRPSIAQPKDDDHVSLSIAEAHSDEDLPPEPTGAEEADSDSAKSP